MRITCTWKSAVIPSLKPADVPQSAIARTDSGSAAIGMRFAAAHMLLRALSAPNICTQVNQLNR